MSSESLSRYAAQARKVASERASGKSVAIGGLSDGASLVNVLGVDYVHTTDEAGGELYLTTVGYRYAEHLQPENWYELSWFRAKRERLPGTALVYAVPTKPVSGESLDLVVKYSRVGEKVPIDTELIENMLCCEFNGPFEEFALVEELRHSRRGPADLRVRTQLPLAIYVPPGETQPSHSGRFQWRIARKVDQHPGVAIDILRQYIVVYRWLPGLDAWQAHSQGQLTEAEARALNERAITELDAKGFKVLDMKPQHVIVELTEADGVVVEDGATRYGVIDFELMGRTPEYWREIQAAQEMTYARHTRELFDGGTGITAEAGPLPGNLAAASILGVDYVHGRAESTGGMLWVVGRAPDLFEFFLPERWRTTPQIRLMDDHETYFTTSKDNVPFVWKVSRVGEPPESVAFGVDGFRALSHGFNSPFEEFATAWRLGRRGIPVIRPRAVYRTGHRSELDESFFDPSRYDSHAGITTLDGDVALDARRNYITVWDHWDGPEDGVTAAAAPVARSLNLKRAVARGLLDHDGVLGVVTDFEERLAGEGVEVFRLLPEHVLIAIGADQALVRDGAGAPVFRLCNFQYLRLPDGMEKPSP